MQPPIRVSTLQILCARLRACPSAPKKVGNLAIPDNANAACTHAAPIYVSLIGSAAFQLENCSPLNSRCPRRRFNEKLVNLIFKCSSRSESLSRIVDFIRRD